MLGVKVFALASSCFGILTASAAAIRDFERRSSPYLNRNTEKFVVDPYGMPEMPFSIGESYAGLLPISSAANETRQLFFWFFPSSNPLAEHEITIWLNGGPGCSSLEGVLTENGPFNWLPGTDEPTPNPYSWTNLTNMVWIEQPIGVGYTTGKPDIIGNRDLAREFMGFWKNFISAFRMENSKVYISGESYAGVYMPYIADAFLKSGDTTYYDMRGLNIINPALGNDTVELEVPAARYMDYWQNILYLNDTFVREAHAAADRCGYTDYLDTYLQYPPPPGPFPKPRSSFYTKGCDLYDSISNAAKEVNPCWNGFHIMSTCPTRTGYLKYFDREDVKKAINAPVDKKWRGCTIIDVYSGPGYSDPSLPPALNGILTSVIEKTNNTLIGVGELDFALLNGTLMVIQNLTWNGGQGFQARPDKKFYTPYHPEYNHRARAGAGYVGDWGSERGLTFYSVQLAGHMIPEYAPGAAYRTMEKMLGRISDLSDMSPFTTQSGDFAGQ